MNNGPQDTTETSWFTQKLAKTLSFLSLPVFKAGVAIPTHAGMTTLTQQRIQAKTRLPDNAITTAVELYKQGGTKRLYSGALPGAVREFTKGCYKGYLYKKTETFFKQRVDPTNPFAAYMIGIPTGFGVGTADAGISAALDRYRTFKTAGGKGNFVSFLGAVWTQHKGDPIAVTKEINRGFSACVSKQIAMAVPFFVSRQMIKQNLKGSNFESQHPTIAAALSKVGPAVLASIFGAPFDVAKANQQAALGVKETMPQIFSRVYAESGMKGLRAGLPISMGFIVFGYTITNEFLERQQGIEEGILALLTDADTLVKPCQPSSLSSLEEQFRHLRIGGEPTEELDPYAYHPEDPFGFPNLRQSKRAFPSAQEGEHRLSERQPVQEDKQGMASQLR